MERQNWPRRALSLTFQCLILFIFWLIFSGHYDPKHLLMGLASASLVTFLTKDLLRTGAIAEKFSFNWPRLLAYLPWLLLAIIKANLQVAYLVLHPKIPVNPRLLFFEPHLKKNLSRVVLANSITLTPGTVTVDLKEGKYIVHALVPKSAEGILSGEMPNKAGEIFGEEKAGPPAFRWMTFPEAKS